MWSTSFRRLLNAAAIAAALVLTANQAVGASFVVTTTEDSIDEVCDIHCSLRDAVVVANRTPGRDQIVIPPGTYRLSLAGRHENHALIGDLDIRETVLIRGSGRQATIIDAGGIDRAFHIMPLRPGESAVEIEDLAITNGDASDGDDGGGVLNTGALAMTRVILHHNRAVGSCAGGGGVANDVGTIALSEVHVVENSSSCTGGGLWNRFGTVAIDRSELRSNRSDGAGGGMYSDVGTVTVTRSTVADNVAEHADARGGGVWARASTVLVQGTTFSNNVASGSGSPGGGGMWTDTSTLSVLNSTISGNRAAAGNGSRGGGIGGRASTVLLTSCTLTANAAERGSALWADDCTISATNTLVDGDCSLSNQLESGGGNLESPAGSCSFDTASDHPFTARSALKLGPLGDNGGPTATHALLGDSAALDAGVSWACPARDQRGERRPADGTGDGEALCDVGAFETQLQSTERFTTWLPVAAHVDGADGTRWRTEMAILNASDAAAELQLVFHGDGISAELDGVLPASAQITYTDVVASFGVADASGVVELRSSQRVIVSSRTANHTVGGSLGQYVGGVVVDEALQAGDIALVPQLRQDDTRSTNLVLSNVGSTAAVVEVRLYDEQGWMLGSTTVNVGPARVRIVTRLFTAVAGGDGAGWAEVEMVEGAGVIAFASAIDRASGDATTIPMHRR